MHKTSFPKQLIFSSTERTDLGIGEATGEPPPILFVSCFCRGAQRPEIADQPSNSSTLQPSSDRKRIINNNHIETLDIVPLPIRKQLSTKYYTIKHFIEKLINLVETLPVIDYPKEHIEDITISKD